MSNCNTLIQNDVWLIFGMAIYRHIQNFKIFWKISNTGIQKLNVLIIIYHSYNL